MPSIFTHETARAVLCILASTAALALSFFDIHPAGLDPAWVAVLLCGVPIICEAAHALVTEFDVKADLLVSLALIASLVIGECFAAGEVAVIMQLGALLEDLTVARARSGIEKLVKLTPETARVVEDGKERVISAAEVAAGAVVRVLPGETIPVDGTILAGETSVDEAVMTGESVPVDKKPGDAVTSGTVNRFGAFTARADKVGSDRTIERMIRLVQSADAGRAKIVRLADRWATWIVVGALVSAFVCWLVTGEAVRAVTILVVFCPCALVLATPTAVMAAVGCAAGRGVLVRAGDALERLADVTRIAFDKTGTLTEGKLAVAAAEPAAGVDSTHLMTVLASLERLSEHPIGKAVAAHWTKTQGELPAAAEDFIMTGGRGVSGRVAGRTAAAGRYEWIEAMNPAGLAAVQEAAKPWEAQGATLLYVVEDGVTLGFAALSDTPRRRLTDLMLHLRGAGVTPILLTGDNETAAQAVAQKAGIREVKAKCLPETKLAVVKAGKTAMVGDGVNDAPALKAAYVGIAMGGVGSDIAVNAADLVLVSDDVHAVNFAVRLARRMMRTIRFNLTFSLALNFLAIILAALGIMGPTVGALVHNAGSVAVILNSAQLLKGRHAKDVI